MLRHYRRKKPIECNTSYQKPAVLKVIDKKHFGSIPNSSTTLALLSMVHDWLKATGAGN